MTPDFLDTFDLDSLCGRDYLKVRMRFASAKLGFIGYTISNKINKSSHIVPVKCCVGSQEWQKRYDRKITDKKQLEIPRF